ncbi:hypothetical protein CVS40_6957 [Lucilia cuprina]|nr:hypothetical protein CVS40_6957 [Lucilia cuprina]
MSLKFIYHCNNIRRSVNFSNILKNTVLNNTVRYTSFFNKQSYDCRKWTM